MVNKLPEGKIVNSSTKFACPVCGGLEWRAKGQTHPTIFADDNATCLCLGEDCLCEERRVINLQELVYNPILLAAFAKAFQRRYKAVLKIE